MGLTTHARRSRAGLLVLGAGLLTGAAVVERPVPGSGAAERALELARLQGNAPLAVALDARAALYRARAPFREKR
jgi:hypothetical protein